MSGLKLSPSASCLAPMGASPLPLRSLARLQTLAPSTAADASTAADKPVASEQPQMKPVARAPLAALAAFQEHISVLRQNLVGAEQTLDTVQPEGFQELKKALLQVSKMISQMESVADALKDKRRDLKNELRTLEEENALLHEAVFRERCKALTRTRSGAILRFDRKVTPPPASRPAPPPPNLRDSGVAFGSVRQLLFTPAITRYWAANDNNPGMDIVFDDAPRSSSASTISPNVGASPGPPASAKRGRAICIPLGSCNGTGVNRFSTAKRGRGLVVRPRPRPVVRPLTANDSIASLTFGPPPARPGYHLLLGGAVPAPAPAPAPFTPESLVNAGQNEIEDLANKMSNRNNRLAGQKAFSVVEWFPPLD
ncbi:uncharacterized protein LOC144105604 [Amblyomma americanum]